MTRLRDADGNRIVIATGIGITIARTATVTKTAIGAGTETAKRTATATTGTRTGTARRMGKRRRRRRRRKKEERDKSEGDKGEKKDKKSKKQKRRDSESPDRGKKRRKREEKREEDRARFKKKDELAELLGKKTVWFTAPGRRHSLTEVKLDDVKGHTTITTVTGDTVGQMSAYCDRINRGEFTTCFRDRGQIRVEIDRRSFGCHANRDNDKVNLFPVDGPTCTNLSHGQLTCMIHLRDDRAISSYVQRWHSGDLPQATEALRKVGIDMK